VNDANAPRSGTLGTAALVAGLLSAYGSFMIYGTTVWFNPPSWFRISSMAMFPLGLLVVVPSALMSMRGNGRSRGIVGLVAAGAGLALFGFAIATLA